MVSLLALLVHKRGKSSDKMPNLSLSDSRDIDLLLLISDVSFYLPDKCQKYHSPSPITLAPLLRFLPPFSPDWIVNSRAASETSAIPQLSVKLQCRGELTLLDWILRV